MSIGGISPEVWAHASVVRAWGGARAGHAPPANRCASQVPQRRALPRHTSLCSWDRQLYHRRQQATVLWWNAEAYKSSENAITLEWYHLWRHSMETEPSWTCQDLAWLWISHFRIRLWRVTKVPLPLIYNELQITPEISTVDVSIPSWGDRRMTWPISGGYSITSDRWVGPDKLASLFGEVAEITSKGR